MAEDAPVRLVLDGNITLRPLTEADITAVRRAVDDPDGRRMLGHWITLSGSAADRDAQVAKRFCDPWVHMYRESFVVCDEARDVIGVRWLDHLSDGSFTTGGWLHANARGYGYGSATMRLVLHYAARVRGAAAMHTGTRNDNAAAQRNMAACGWAHVATSVRPDHVTDPDAPEELQLWEADLTGLAALGPIPVGKPAPKYKRRRYRHRQRRIHRAA